MAREAANREDLLREATALVERVELSLTGFAVPWVVGFRANGCASIYVGEEPAYHFNSSGALRRVFREGVMFKAEDGRLVALSRHRTLEEVQLVRHLLTADETRQVLAELGDLLTTLSRALNEETYRILRQVPAEAGLVGRLRQWLGNTKLAIARSPHAR